MCMKKKAWLCLVVVAVFAALLTTLAGCSFINKILGRDDKKVKAPVITGLETIKATDGYLESKEYLFNKGCTNPMALNDLEKYYVVISYDNPDKLPVSSVKINNVKYDSTRFASGSDTTNTRIEFSVEENALSGIIDYVINNVMYMNGSETTKMKWAEGVENTISVSVRPQFNLTLNPMNVDYRMGNANIQEEIANVKNATSSKVFYSSELSYANVVSPDFDAENYVGPRKSGGWVFAGWYTKPNGEGELVQSTDKYYFWCDMTLYAHYERMYDFEVVQLDTPINYEYSAGNTYKFTAGVRIVNKDFKNNEVTHFAILDIPDTIVIEDITYTETEGNYGLPVYTPKVSYTEYPVIGIGSLAFKGFNTIRTATVGKFIEEIGYGAFWRCTKMTSLTFNGDSELKYIGDYAFYETKVLGKDNTFSLPEKVEYLGNLAFRDSGWTNVPSKNGVNTTTLTVSKNWKFIGYKCFMNTGFSQVVFEPGCYFEGQIDDIAGYEIESKEGNRVIEKGKNLIGAKAFASCLSLTRIDMQADKDEKNGINIIPDNCFDINNYEKDESKIAYVKNVFFAEGLKKIGQKAFFYQKRITSLELPASLEDVDCFAFYQCEDVTKLTFGGKDSQLKYLHSEAFGNLTNLDSVTITGKLLKYGSGVFRGCDRMKCVFFDNEDMEQVPKGYLKDERKDAKGKDLEVVVGHKQSDFLFATGEAGEKEKLNQEDEATNTDAVTYSSPLRLFVPSGLVEAFKEEMKKGKEVTAGGQSSGTSAYNSSVFVHDIDLVKDYTYTDEEGKEITVKVAVQEIYSSTNLQTSSNVIGYSLVYWSDRSTYVRLPVQSDIDVRKDIIEIAHYALPTSIRKVYVPSSYTMISHDAFNSCTNLTEVVFADVDTLEYIGDYAFFGTAIKEFIGGKKLKAIGQYAFQRCRSLQVVDLRTCPITNKKDGRMKNRDNYKYEYELKDNKKDYNNSLGYGAFKGCAALYWIYLPKVQQICSDTFTGCKALRTVIIPTSGSDMKDTTSATDDDAFYQYGQPTTVYDPANMHNLHILVDSSAAAKHEKILELGAEREDEAGNMRGYGNISSQNTVRPTVR